LATAYCTILIVTMSLAILLMHIMVRRMEGIDRQQQYGEELEAVNP
jgi:hypothetical protein